MLIFLLCGRRWRARQCASISLPAIAPGDSYGYFLGKELGHRRFQVLKSQLFSREAEQRLPGHVWHRNAWGSVPDKKSVRVIRP